MVNKLVHYRASLKQMSNNKRSSKVVVHSIIALLTQFAYKFLCSCIALGRYSYAVEIRNAVHQLLKSLLRSLQCLVAEVYSSTVMGR